MALTICPACGKQVSTSATVCPHCGASIDPQSTSQFSNLQQPANRPTSLSYEKKNGVWGILALVVMILSVVLSNLNGMLWIIAQKHYGYSESFSFHFNQILEKICIFPILSLLGLTFFILSYFQKENEKLRMITALISIGESLIWYIPHLILNLFS